MRSALAPRTIVAAAVAAFATLALLAAPAARPDNLPLLLDLGPVTVANGTAIVSGTVGGAHAASAHVTVDGQPLDVTDLNPEREPVIELTSDHGQI